MDLLGGLGDFEKCGTFSWASHNYDGTDAFWDAKSDEWHREQTYVWGYNRCRTGDSVALGWRRVTGPTVEPGTNATYQLIVGEGIAGSICQYFAIRGVKQGSAYAQLLTPPFIVGSGAYDIHSGDQVTFRIDHIRMSGYDKLPEGTIVNYKLRLYWEGGGVEKVLPKSKSPLSSPHNEVVCTVPSGVSDIRASVTIESYGDLGSEEAGVYVDGARLLVKRFGESDYVKEIVPIEKNRKIKTSRLFLKCNSNTEIRTAAQNYDLVMLDESRVEDALRLKYYNPKIKVFLYLLTNIRDGRYYPTREGLRSPNTVELRTVMTNHPEWLYPYSDYPYSKPDQRSPHWKKLPYKFESIYPGSPTYYTRLDNADFQAAWVQGAIAKAKLYPVDGIWIDTLSLAPWDLPERGGREIQAFVHAVVPKLRSAGLSIIVNSCSEHLEPTNDLDTQGIVGASKTNPWWQPTASLLAMGYKPNLPSITAEGMQQEYAFFKPAPGFQPNIIYGDGSYWLRCLLDMDSVKRWNQATGERALTRNEQRWLHLQATAMKIVDEQPALGLDGWVRYALCSYLLAQNEWTTFGCSFHPSFEQSDEVGIDAGVTTILGVPSGDHKPYLGDAYLRYRIYEADSEGGVGGVVVVNANSEPRNYKLDFNAVDELGQFYSSGSIITLKPYTGRIMLRAQQLSLTVNVPKTSVKPGEEITVTVTYRNDGDSEIKNTLVVVKIPDGVVYSEGSAESNGGRYDAGLRTVTWTVGNVPARGSGVKLFKVRTR